VKFPNNDIATNVYENVAAEAWRYSFATVQGRTFMFGTYAGLSMLWAMMRRRVDPTMTLERAREEVSVENFDRIANLAKALNGFVPRSEVDNEGNPTAPTTPNLSTGTESSEP
jgi:hypothetical protein